MHKTLKRVALSAGLVTMLAVLVPMFVLADSITSNFESSTLGNVNGQDGWVKTGSFDVNVVANTYGIASFGAKTLQISDAVTSGSFADQLFSKPLVNEAGETDALNSGMSGGTRQSHFEAQFDFASTQATVQPGMHMSVSPDRGDGARMSYLRFDDSASGIDVFFDDVQGTTNPATFVETKIATISRSAHTIKMTLDAIDGPSNDVVKVYIDGNLIHIGTSWENYYRFDPESNPGLANNNSRTVDSLLFRESGTANVLDLGKGFLIDNLTLSSGAAPAGPANSTVVVHPADMATSPADVTSTPTKWFFYNDENDTIDNTLGSFVTGPATAPLGTGSAQISVTGTQRRNLATYQFGGIKLGDIITLKFSTYNPSAGNGGSANSSAYLHFNVDFTGNSSSWQKRLVFVPNQNGTVVQNSWQEWDAIQMGTAKYAYSGATWPATATGPDAGLTETGDTLRTWNDLLADYPGIRILPGDSWLGLRVGEPYPNGYTENLDKFVLATGSSMTTWDFDPAAPANVTVTIQKYIGNSHATAVNANNAVFPFTANYQASNVLGGNAGQDPFDVGPVGNGTLNAYEAQTIPLAPGASYSASENVTGNDVVGASCADGKPFALAGYSSGNTFAEAFANASSSMIAPAFTNLQSDKVVIVWNKVCPVVVTPTVKVHILKYLNNSEATAVTANNYQFPMIGTWKTANLNGGATSTGNYVLGNGHGGAALYGADTSPMNVPANYLTNEVTGEGSQVVTSKTQCAPGKYVLEGYKVGSSFADAATAATSTEVALYGITSDQYVLVYNTSCPTKATLTVYKNTIGGNGTFNFTGSLGTFSIATAANTGNKVFTDLAPGTYTVTETAQAGWTMTENTCTNLSVVAGDNVSCTIVNTNNSKLGSIRGTKFEDWDGDGKAFETKWEVGLAGFTVYLDTNNNGAKDAGEQSTVTDSHGVYSFTNLPAGSYHVREVQQTGWTQTYPSANVSSNKYDITLAAGQNVKKKDFGNFKLGVISGMKYNDVNGNGRKGSQEPGLSGWTIKIKGNNGYTSQAITDAQGNYSFTGLPAGNYQVSEVMQNGWKQTDKPGQVKIRSAVVSTKNDFGNTQKTNPNNGHN